MYSVHTLDGANLVSFRDHVQVCVTRKKIQTQSYGKLYTLIGEELCVPSCRLWEGVLVIAQGQEFSATHTE